MEYKEKPTRKSFVDLEGNQYGMLRVLGYCGNDRSRHLWHVECSCGTSKIMNGSGIQRGLTKSCGCLRKNNGGKRPLTREEAESLCQHIKFIEYNGMKHPAKYECIYCGKVGEIKLANNLRAFICDCRNSNTLNKRTEVIKDKGYTLLGMVGRKYKIKCDMCNTEKLYQGGLEYLEYCPCSQGVSDGTPCAIYCLHSNTDRYIKVGKSVSPRLRLDTINKDRETQGLSPLELYYVVWVTSEKAAYYLESMYHSEHKNKRLYLENWTGSTETFELGVDSFDRFLNKHNKLIETLKTQEPVKPRVTLNLNKTYPYAVIVESIWYPSMTSAAQYLKVSTDKLKRYLSGEICYEELISKKIYVYEGVEYNTLKEICDTYKINPNLVYKRILKGYEIKEIFDALRVKSNIKTRTRNVIVNGESMGVADMWRKYGLNPKVCNNRFLKMNRDYKAVLRYFGIFNEDIIETST